MAKEKMFPEGQQETKQRKSHVPANVDRITSGAMKLSLEQMISLKNSLDREVRDKLQLLKDQVSLAEESYLNK